MRECGSLSPGLTLISVPLESTNCPGSGGRRTLFEHYQVDRRDGKGVEEGGHNFYLLSNANNRDITILLSQLPKMCLVW